MTKNGTAQEEKPSMKQFEELLVYWADVWERLEEEKKKRFHNLYSPVTKDIPISHPFPKPQQSDSHFASKSDVSNYEVILKMNPLVAEAVLHAFNHLVEWKKMDSKAREEYLRKLNHSFTRKEYRKHITSDRWEGFLISQLRKQFRDQKEKLMELKEQYTEEHKKYLKMIADMRELQLLE